MDRRLELDDIFRKITSNVYYQPPENLKLVYPCIVYELDQIVMRYANNRPYDGRPRYCVTSISRDPESRITKQIATLPMCRHEKHFVNDNLHHDVFIIY